MCKHNYGKESMICVVKMLLLWGLPIWTVSAPASLKNRAQMATTLFRPVIRHSLRKVKKEIQAEGDTIHVTLALTDDAA